MGGCPCAKLGHCFCYFGASNLPDFGTFFLGKYLRYESGRELGQNMLKHAGVINFFTNATLVKEGIKTARVMLALFTVLYISGLLRSWFLEYWTTRRFLTRKWFKAKLIREMFPLTKWIPEII